MQTRIRKNTIQPKLTIGQPNDRFEQEADRIADQVMKMPSSQIPPIQRKCDNCEEEELQMKPLSASITPIIQKQGEEEETLQMKGLGSDMVSDSNLQSSLQQSKGGGQAMDVSTQSQMSYGIGADFSRVKVHTNSSAIQMNQQLNAKAFTNGRDVYFNQGQYNPQSSEGKHLLAHELTHVVQQTGKREGNIAQTQIIQRQDNDANTSPSSMSLEEELEASRQALAEIHEQMSTGLFDWRVSEAEAREVFAILRRQEPTVLLRVVQTLRISDRGRRFLNALSEEDRMDFDTFSDVISRDTGYLSIGDIIRIVVFANTRQSEPEFTLDLNVERGGIRPFFLDEPVSIVNLIPQAAATLIARAYREGQIFVEPRVRLLVLERGPFYAPRHGPTNQIIWFEAIERLSSEESANTDKRAEFLDYIRIIDISEDPTLVNASIHYMNWYQENYGNEEFLERSPSDLWSWALDVAMTPLPETPIQPFLDLLRHQQSRLDTTPQADQTVLLGAVSRYLDWIDRHMEANDFASFDPVDIWVSSYSRSSDANISDLREATFRRVMEESRENERVELMAAREERFQEHFNIAMELWGYSQRNFPYSIPIPSEGRDILVTGHPARQVALDMLASALMDHAVSNMFDSNYTSGTQSPESVLLNFLEGDLGTALDIANSMPVASESIDRNEILPGRVLASFGQTVGIGLLVIGTFGAAVGAGVVSAPVAAVLLVGVAGYAGITSYLDRREEIEEQDYEVPIEESVFHSMGDVVGLSQLIEGMTGERLGTGRNLTSIERSDQAGSGAGGMVLLLTGSKAYRYGQARGQRFRLNQRGNIPPGPEGRGIPNPEEVPPVDTTRPVPSENMGPIETTLRNSLDQEVRIGFDQWMAELRAAGNNPETSLGRIPSARRGRVARQRAETNTRRFLELLRHEELRIRSMDNPLNPQMRITEQAVPGDNGVLIRHNGTRPGTHEIEQAILLHQRTGEPIEIFGRTARGNDYPGIDGIIGSPPRPLSLKHGNPQAPAHWARNSAEEALISASDQGYSHVEVHIELAGRTISEIQTAWNGPSMNPAQSAPRPVMSGDTIARIVIQALDGIWLIEPPLTGPGLPGIIIPLPETEEERE